MIELFSIGHFSISLLGVTSALGMIIGLLLIQKEGERKRLDKDMLMDLGLYTALLGIIGARLGYILFFNLDHYLANPLDIFKISQGGLSIQGAILVAGSFAFWFMKKKKMAVWKTADAIVPGVILGQAIGRVGCDVFGVPMSRNWPWGVMVGGELLHPAQLYEVALNFILFLIIWRRRQTAKFDGELFFIYVIGFAFNRFIVEFFRSNPQAIGSLSIAHVLSLLIIVLGLLLLMFMRNKQVSQIEYTSEAGTLKNAIVYGIIVLGFIVSVVFYYGIHFIYSR
ncbi:phosphatidylglycerol:prolipoprotein diacylglycerol transferase [Alkalibacterium subtropicum]|uniref:Phosphatidylglycerol--prolipoprotein diacylglyceryl transferase n=1 Tax=Alkalibacterium subtropicum TaxID=753702 RepID=A0A1I1FX93_9LACT|nr:prolipoprotein diacylglyceryl transferase [Alkalibacterium subtropicum]SFC03954.1 phosphatidylglycerol:prolipoprotein diacylglycerol transferase [Alkalibacterium subtropicum]